VAREGCEGTSLVFESSSRSQRRKEVCSVRIFFG